MVIVTGAHRLGSWTCPSGQEVTAFLRPASAGGVPSIEVEWSAPFPVAPADIAHYLAVIRPELVARIREYTERVGPVLVVTL